MKKLLQLLVLVSFGLLGASAWGADLWTWSKTKTDTGAEDDLYYYTISPEHRYQFHNDSSWSIKASYSLVMAVTLNSLPSSASNITQFQQWSSGSTYLKATTSETTPYQVVIGRSGGADQAQTFSIPSATAPKGEKCIFVFTWDYTASSSPTVKVYPNTTTTADVKQVNTGGTANGLNFALNTNDAWTLHEATIYNGLLTVEQINTLITEKTTKVTYSGTVNGNASEEYLASPAAWSELVGAEATDATLSAKGNAAVVVDAATTMETLTVNEGETGASVSLWGNALTVSGTTTLNVDTDIPATIDATTSLGSVTVAAGKTVTLGAVKAYSVGPFICAGEGATLNKTGVGTMTFTTAAEKVCFANNMTVNVNAGKLMLATSDAGDAEVQDATLAFTGSSTFESSGFVKVKGEKGLTVNVEAGKTLELAGTGVLSSDTGTAPLVKTGAGTLKVALLGSSNTAAYAGAVTIEAGTLELKTRSDGTQPKISGAILGTGTLKVTGLPTVTGSLADFTGTLVIANGGKLDLSGVTLNDTMTITVEDGGFVRVSEEQKTALGERLTVAIGGSVIPTSKNTSEAFGTQTFDYVFTGIVDANYTTQANWDLYNNVTWPTGYAPAFSSSNAWGPILIDGDQMAIAPDAEGYKTVTLTGQVEGWNLRLGLANHARLKMQYLNKMQGGSSWIRVDETSQLELQGFQGTGNWADDNMNFYISAPKGLRATCQWSRGGGLTYIYYLDKKGSVEYAAGWNNSARTHNVNFVLDVGAESTKTQIIKRPLILSNGTNQSVQTFNFSSVTTTADADGSATLAVSKDTMPTVRDAVGTYYKSVEDDGCYVYYVAYVYCPVPEVWVNFTDDVTCDNKVSNTTTTYTLKTYETDNGYKLTAAEHTTRGNPAYIDLSAKTISALNSTVSFLAKPEGNDWSDMFVLVYGDGTAYQKVHCKNAAGNKVAIYGSSGLGAPDATVNSTGINMVAGKLNHWVIVTETGDITAPGSTTTQTVYVNGEPVASYAITGFTTENATFKQLELAGWTDDSQRRSLSAVADIRVYDEVLTEDYIAKMYNRHSATLDADAALTAVAWESTGLTYLPAEQDDVKLSVTGTQTVTLDAATTLATLTVLPSGEAETKKLTLTGDALTVGRTTVDENLDVSAITADLGDVTIAAGKVLTLGANTTYRSLSGEGTLAVGDGATLTLGATVPAFSAIGNNVTLTALAGSTVDLSGATFGTGVKLIVDVSNGLITGATTSPFALPEGVTVTYEKVGELPSAVLGFDSATGAITENFTPADYQVTWMPMGDSITEGESLMGKQDTDDSKGNAGGYRYQVWKMLDGTNGTGTAEDGAGQELRTVGLYTGHQGTKDDETGIDWAWHAGIYSGTIMPNTNSRGAQMFNVESAYENAGYPEVTSLLLGVNDLGVSSVTAEQAFGWWTTLVQKLRATRPYTKVVVSTLLPTTAGHAAKAVEFNNLMRAAATATPKQAPFDDDGVIFIDVSKHALNDKHSGGTGSSGNFRDEWHPNLAGSIQVGSVFRLGIMEALQKVQAEDLAIVQVHNGEGDTVVVRLNKKPTEAVTSATLTLNDVALTNAGALRDADPRVIAFTLTDEEKTSILGATTATLTLNEGTPMVADTTKAHIELLGSGAAANIPEDFRGNFVPYKTITIGTENGATNPTEGQADVVSDILTEGLTAETPIRRVGYYMELKRPGKPAQFVWVSMDATGFDNLAGHTELPYAANTTEAGNIHSTHAVVENLAVYGNRGNFSKSVKDAKGVVEMFPYGWKNGAYSSDANWPEDINNLYGWNDALNTGIVLGCLQVARIRDEADLTKGAWEDPRAEMLFAYNGFNHATMASDVGIGSLSTHRTASGVNSSAVYDWSLFSYNMNYTQYIPSAYESRILEIWVQVKEPATVTWTGATDSSWETGSNWDLGQCPTIGDSVVLSANAVHTLTLTTGEYAYAFSGEGGKLAIADGATVTLTGENTYTGGTAIGEGATLTIPTATALGAGAITGSGTLVYPEGYPTHTDGLTDETWTGIVVITDASIDNSHRLEPLGNASSTIRLTGTASGTFGWVTTTSKTLTCASTIELEGTLNITAGHLNHTQIFTGALTGNGTYVSTNSDEYNHGNYVVRFENASDFEGTITVNGIARTLIGSSGTPDAGTLLVAGAANIAEGKTWTANNGITVAGTIGGAGTLGSATTFAAGSEIDLREGELTATGALTWNGTAENPNIFVMNEAPVEGMRLMSGALLAAPTAAKFVNAEGAAFDGTYYVETTAEGLAVTLTAPTIRATVNGVGFADLQEAVSAAGAEGTITIVGTVGVTDLDLSSGTKVAFAEDATLTITNLYLGESRNISAEPSKITVTGEVIMVEGPIEETPIPLSWTMGAGAKVTIYALNCDYEHPENTPEEVLTTDKTGEQKVTVDANGINFFTTLDGRGAWYEWLFEDTASTTDDDDQPYSTGRQTTLSRLIHGTNVTPVYIDVDGTGEGSDYPLRRAVNLQPVVFYSDYETHADSSQWGIEFSALTEFTASLYARMPSKPGSVFIQFGKINVDNSSHGAIALVTGKGTDEVLLVYTPGPQVGGKSIVLSKMKAPHATDVYHLYTFVRRPTGVEVYLDDTLVTRYTGENILLANGGVQMGNVYGGIGNMGTRKMIDLGNGETLEIIPAEELDATDAKPAAIDMLRLYDCQLTGTEVERLASEYAYESTYGDFTRTVMDDDVLWKTDTATWTKLGETTSYTEPTEGANVILTASADATVTVNPTLTEGLTMRTLEELILDGDGALTFVSGENATPIEVEGVTEIKTDVTVENTAMKLRGPVKVAAGKTLKILVEASIIQTMAVEVLAAGNPVSHNLTGLVSGEGSVVGEILGGETLPVEWKLETLADERTGNYVIKLSHNPWFIEVDGDEVVWKSGPTEETAEELGRTTEGASTVPLNLAGCAVTVSGSGNLTLPGGHAPSLTFKEGAAVAVTLTTTSTPTYPLGDNTTLVTVPATEIDALTFGGDAQNASSLFGTATQIGGMTFAGKGKLGVTSGSLTYAAKFADMTIHVADGAVLYTTTSTPGTLSLELEGGATYHFPMNAASNAKVTVLPSATDEKPARFGSGSGGNGTNVAGNLILNGTLELTDTSILWGGNKYRIGGTVSGAGHLIVNDVNNPGGAAAGYLNASSIQLDGTNTDFEGRITVGPNVVLAMTKAALGSGTVTFTGASGSLKVLNSATLDEATDFVIPPGYKLRPPEVSGTTTIYKLRRKGFMLIIK